MRSMVSFATFFLLLAVSALAPAAIDRDQSQEFFEDAVDYFRAESYTQAIIQLRNALQQDPNNLPARIMLGETLLRENQPEAAIKELEKAQSMGGDENLILVPLANAYLEIGKFEHVITGFNPDGHLPEVQGELLMMQGESYAQLGNRKFAEEAFLGASTAMPADPRPLLGLARMKLSRGKHKDGYKLLEQAVGIAPDSFEVWSFKAIMHRDYGQYEAAMEAFSKALEIRPASVRTLAARAAMWMDLGEIEKARADIELANGLEGDTLETIYLKTLLLFRDGKADEAREALRESADEIREIRDDVRSKLPNTILMLGVVAYFEGNYDEAIAYLTKFRTSFPNHHGAKRYLATAYLALKEYDEVIKVYRPSSQSKIPGDPMALALIAEAYRGSGNFKQAEKYFETALALAPGTAGIGIKLAMSRLESGQAEEAVVDLEKLAERFPDFAEVKAQLARAYVKTGAINKAVEVAAELASEHGDSAQVQNVVGTVYLAAGSADDARNHIELAASMDPELIQPKINLARLARLQGNLASAEVRYRAVLEQFPFNTIAGLELAELLLASGEAAEADERIRKVLETEPQLFAAHELRIRALLNAGAERERIESTVYELLQNFPEEAKANIIAGRAFRTLGSDGDARVHFRRAVEKAEFDAEILFSAANQQFGMGDYSGALWSLTKAQQASPDRSDIAVLRTAVLVQLKEFDKAEELVNATLEKYGDKASILTVQGDLYMARGEGEEGVGVYRRAYALAPSYRTMSTLFRALVVTGDHDGASEIMDAWLVDQPRDVAARHLYAQMLVAQKEWARARAIYESLQSDGVEDIVMMNNLAVIYQHLGDKRALPIAEAAYAKAPEDSNVIDTYGWILTENGRTEEGLALLREAYARASTTPSIRYHVGLALSRLGRTREAQEEVEAALATGVGFPGKEAAEALLSQIKQGN